jgi:predicted RND superfamily exporter protein
MTTEKRGLVARIVSVITDRPWTVLLISLATLFVFASGVSRMTANFTHTAFFRKTDPALQRFEAFERRFGNDDAVIVVVNSPSGIFDAESAGLLRSLTDKMWKVPEVIRVDSLSNFQWVHAQGDDIEIEPLLPRDGTLTEQLLSERKKVALEHEILPGYMISRDAKTAVVYARLKPGIDAPPNAKLIAEETNKVIASLEGGDHTFHMTGGPVLNDAFRASAEKDMSILVPGLLLMVAALLVFTFRRAGGVVMPFAIIIASVIAAFAASGWLGLEMSSPTFSVPQVLIAVCVAECVHILAAFYRARKAGLTRHAAATYTLNKNFVPTLLTSSTTAFGFLSFMTADMPPIEIFGILCGIGTTLSWFLTYSIVGPMMVLWPGKEPTSGETSIEDSLSESTPRSRAFIGFIDRNRWAVVGAFAAVSAASLAIATLNAVNSNPYEYFRSGLPVRKAQDFVLKNLDGIGSFEIVVDAGREDGIKDPVFLGKVERLEKSVLEIEGVNRAVSIVDILRQMNRALSGGSDADYKLPATSQGVAQELLLYTMGLPQGMDVNDRMTIKNDAMRITLVSTITESNAAVAAAERIEKTAKALGLDAHVTGKMLLYQGMNGRVVDSFLSSLGSAVLLIGLIMVFSFRSIRLGFISMIPNVVPLMAGGAVLYFLSGTLDIGTVLVASVALGIAVDNTIHILTHFNRHVAEGLSPKTSLESLMAHSGPAMLSTTAILVMGFMTLAFGDFIPNVYFGVLTAIILVIGMITDFVLLPAILLIAVKDTSAKAEAPPVAISEPRAA